MSRGVLTGRATALDQLESSLNLPLKLNYWHYRSWPEMYCGIVLCAEDSMLLLPIGSYYSSRSCHMELWSCKGLFLYLNWQFQTEIIMISEVEQERRKGTFIPIFFLLYIYTSDNESPYNQLYTCFQYIMCYLCYPVPVAMQYRLTSLCAILFKGCNRLPSFLRVSAC